MRKVDPQAQADAAASPETRARKNKFREAVSSVRAAIDAASGATVGMKGAAEVYDVPGWGEVSWQAVRSNPGSFSWKQAFRARLRAKGVHPQNVYLDHFVEEYGKFWNRARDKYGETYVQALANLMEKFLESGKDQLKRVFEDGETDLIRQLWNVNIKPDGPKELMRAKLGWGGGSLYSPEQNASQPPSGKDYFEQGANFTARGLGA